MVLILILLIVLGVYTLSLSNRIKNLEERIDTLTNNLKSRPTTVSTPADSAFIQVPQSNFNTISTIPPTPNRFFEWVKQDFLVKLGALLLLIALGWFVSYAFANNWIGPAGRITIGLLVGVLFLAVGAWRITLYKQQGSIFAVLGSTTIIATVFAARELYDFFTPTSSLFLMFISVVFVAFLSVRFKASRLAVAGLILAAAAPIFTAAPAPDILNLFLYLTVIVLGSIWVVFLTGWSMLTPIALLAVALYSAPFLIGYGISVAEQNIGLLFAFTFTALFFVTNVVSTIRRPQPQHLSAQVLTAIFSVIYLVAWITEAVSNHLQSLVFVTWALVFAVGAYLVYVATHNRIVFYLYSTMAVGLIGAATAAELSGPALTIAYIIESGLLLFLVTFVRAPQSIVRSAALVLIIPGLLALESVDSPAWREGIFHADFVVITLMTTVLIMVTVKFYLWNTATEDKVARDYTRIFFVVTTFFITLWIWLVSHALFEIAGTTLALVVYTLIGLSAYIYGLKYEIKLLKTMGIVFIGGVVLRLLLVDIWDMPLTGRIITFFIIGVLLISTAFINKNKSLHHD